MIQLLELFRSRCDETEILDGLLEVAKDARGTWHRGRGLFEQSRARARIAGRENDTIHKFQCDFEEICGKTLYNLSGHSAPFDADSPFWIIPNALSLGEVLGIDSEIILKVLKR